MIEFCNRRRMLIVVVALIGVTLLALGFETFLTNDNGLPTLLSSNSSENACWLIKKFTVVKECQHCSQFDLTRKLDVCIPTGFKESVRCYGEEEPKWRSCDRLPWTEKRNFWIFEGVAFTLGLFSGLITYSRQRQLNRRTLDRIQKQISAGV